MALDSAPFASLWRVISPSIESSGSVESWKKIGSFGLGRKDKAYYVASLAEINQSEPPNQTGDGDDRPRTFVLSLGLERVGNYVFYSPMKSERHQRLVSDYVLVLASRIAEFGCITRGVGEDGLLEEQLDEGRCVGMSTGSVEALDLAKYWLQQCLKHHVRCTKLTARSQLDVSVLEHNDLEVFCPTRLVQILPRKLRLHTPSSDNLASDGRKPYYRYATLSHRWPSDSDRILQLTTSNVQRWHHEIDQGHSFSQSFKDAITVCRHLGIEYIWIDSLCIIQKGDGGEDWQKEAARMGSVYKWGICNIAATSVTDGDEGITKGFFRSRDPSMTRPTIISARSNLESFPREGDGLINRIGSSIRSQNTGMVDYHIVPSQRVIHDVVNSTLNQRGWVVQERHMSPRIIHFAERQIYWECNEVVCSETYPKRDPVELHLRNSKTKRFLPQLAKHQDKMNLLSPQISSALTDTSTHIKSLPWGLYNLWYDMVAVYSSCSLTKKSDKLIAIAGIARELRNRLNVPDTDYIAGLWRQNLLYGLLWQTTVITTPNSRAQRPGSPGVEEYQAPTWSWASVDCAISVSHNLFHKPHTTLATIIGVHVVPKADPYGEIRHGASLEIEGTVYKVKLRYSRLSGRLWPELMIGTPIDGHIISTKARGSFAVLPDEPPPLVENTDRVRDLDVYMLPILKSDEDCVVRRRSPRNSRWFVSLLLVPVENDGSTNTYRRHGIVELRGEGSDNILDLGPLSRRICKPELKVMSII
ncbi:hypothetical protein CIB48_g6623 [Xylaria polymorpha]|nr:hypothetical protein CIB48_g6623 [Xylaria polymorpha]